MDIGEWWSTRDWAATGAMLTAGFTAASAYMMLRNRPRTVLAIDPIAYGLRAPTDRSATLTFAVRNLGTRPVIGARVKRVRPGIGSKPLGERIAAIQPGESIEFQMRYSIEQTEPYVLNEETGTYPKLDPETVDFGDDMIEVTFLRPPKLDREQSKTVRVDTMRQALRENAG